MWRGLRRTGGDGRPRTAGTQGGRKSNRRGGLEAELNCRWSSSHGHLVKADDAPVGADGRLAQPAVDNGRSGNDGTRDGGAARLGTGAAEHTRVESAREALVLSLDWGIFARAHVTARGAAAGEEADGSMTNLRPGLQLPAASS